MCAWPTSGVPLADRMRPASLDEVVGQDALVGPAAPFRLALNEGRLRSCVLWGPPGSGKTTLARLIGATAGRVESLSAVHSGVRDLKAVLDGIPPEGPRTVLFVDEIHRWNKAQQDALLPVVESGRIVLVGATTENPAFHLIPALRSRTELIVLAPLDVRAIETVLRRALADPRGLSGVVPEEGVIPTIARVCDGDARRALGMLERLADRGTLTLQALSELGVAVLYDRDGDQHYDVVSAFIKSMRGSDPDAAVYWLARMVAGGEDPVFIGRRMAIFAAEDIGNADPRALTLAVSAMEGAARIGMPEARILLAQAALYLATAPKSNAAYLAIGAALDEVRASGALPVPLPMRSKPVGVDPGDPAAEYRYPHDFPDHVVRQTYLPAALSGRTFYAPAPVANEKVIADRLAWWERKLRERGE